jgi:hypothetical protein
MGVVQIAPSLMRGQLNKFGTMKTGAYHYHGDALVGIWMVVPHCSRINCSSLPLFASLFPFGSTSRSNDRAYIMWKVDWKNPKLPRHAQTHLSYCRFRNFCTAPWDFTFAVIL